MRTDIKIKQYNMCSFFLEYIALSQEEKIMYEHHFGRMKSNISMKSQRDHTAGRMLALCVPDLDSVSSTCRGKP